VPVEARLLDLHAVDLDGAGEGELDRSSPTVRLASKSAKLPRNLPAPKWRTLKPTEE
jgi:hypothetical protein